MNLLVVLASPPTTTGQRTLSRLTSLPAVVPCSVVSVANLYANPARDLPALSLVGGKVDGWLEAREQLRHELASCDEMMAAWGLLALTGTARQHRSDQVRWLLELAAQQGHTQVWTIGGQPRHPSRWHQYVSDVHGRTQGGSFEDRLREVLVQVPLSSLTS